MSSGWMHLRKADIIIVLILVSGVMFDYVKIGGYMDHSWFPLIQFCHNWGEVFSPVKVNAYIYYFIEHVIVLAFVAMLIAESQENKHYKVLLLIMALHLADFILTYNLVWFRVFEFPISMNTMDFFLYCGYIIDEKWKPQNL